VKTPVAGAMPEAVLQCRRKAWQSTDTVGQALGYEIEPIRRMPSEKWVAASEGGPAALEGIDGVMLAGLKRMTENGPSVHRAGHAQGPPH